MLVAYIAGPYRAKTPYGIVRNIRAAERVAIKYWKQGYAVICPHKNSALMDGSIGNAGDVKMADGNIWMEGDLAILAKCDVIVMMRRWRQSQGARTEHDFAVKHGIRVIYDK